jgi:predicted patatin/cPLA2 family phospholipase
MRLVLAGGGVRGAFTAGVLSVLADEALPVTSVFGASAGALNGAYFCSGQLGLLRRVWGEFVSGPGFVSLPRALRGGTVTDIDGLIEAIRDRFPLDRRALEQAACRFHTCATDLATGEAVVSTPGAADVLEWLRASAAVPFGYHRSVRIDGRDLVDGSLGAPLGSDRLPPAPEELQVVVLTLPMTHRRSTMHPLVRRASSALFGAPMTDLLHRYGPLYNAAVEAAIAAWRREELAIIAPALPLPVSRISSDPKAIREAMRLGEEAGRAFVRAWRAGRGRAAG